eukprot:GEMP01040906.1.p1 GENE.GEMP01040906.1~~GEMP01040906.1.p1  ORF type:complete len:358 (+),score=62.73 GEMP01040906.1:97-1170(+)
MASVYGQYLGGQSAIFDGCASIGHLMTRVAINHQRFASDVVVLPMRSGEVLPCDDIPPPEVYIVLKTEEAQLTQQECKINVRLHAAAEDTSTVVRALAMLQDVAPGETHWPRDVLLCDASEDPEKENTLRTLMRAGVDGTLALTVAACRSNTGAVQRLICARVNVNAADHYGRHALFLASVRGDHETVQILVDAKADTNIAEVNGMTALLIASGKVYNGYKEVVKILVDARANINYTTPSRPCPLARAAMSGYKDTVRILVNARADVNNINLDFHHAIKHSYSSNRKEIWELLIAERANTKTGKLMVAFQWGRKKMTQMRHILVDAGAYIGKLVMPPLQWGRAIVVQILVAAGRLRS